MSFAVVIPSRNFSNLRACVAAIHQNEEACRLVIVDDGLQETGYYPNSTDYNSGGCIDGSTIIRGIKPFIFARNINLGIVAAGRDDVLILGDDGLLKTPGGFSLLSKAVMDHPEYGILSATMNNVGNQNQWPAGIGLREESRVVCFVAVYIPRRTVDAVGLMDERFIAYGFDDDDYCLRIRNAGLKLGIHDGCYVDHGSLTSAFRGNPAAPANLEDGRRIFVEKWGSHPL